MWLSSMLHKVTVLLHTCELECLDASEGDNIEYQELMIALDNRISTDSYSARLSLSFRIDRRASVGDWCFIRYERLAVN